MAICAACTQANGLDSNNADNNSSDSNNRLPYEYAKSQGKRNAWASHDTAYLGLASPSSALSASTKIEMPASGKTGWSLLMQVAILGQPNHAHYGVPMV